MELGEEYRLGEDFKVIIWKANHEEMRPFFMAGSWPLEKPNKDFKLTVGETLGWMEWLNNGLGKGFIFHAVIPALYPFCWKCYGLS